MYPAFRKKKNKLNAVVPYSRLPANDSRLFLLFPIFAALMIAYLKGDFVHKSPAVVHVDVNGVGYEVQISLNTYSKIQNLKKDCYTPAFLSGKMHIFYMVF